MAAMAQAGIIVNVVFLCLNLLPILPLDGGRILVSLLPQRMAWQYARLEPWGLPVLVLLLMTNVLDDILNPLVGLSHAVIRALVL
jgi:Zn-dependent protease